MSILTEGTMKGGNGVVKTGASQMKPSIPPMPPVKPPKSDDVEILSGFNPKDLLDKIDFLEEQLFHTQECMRRLMIALSAHMSSYASDEITSIFGEWSEIIHDINKEHNR